MTTLVIFLLTVLSILIVTIYTGAVCIKGRRVPNSISATFYALAHKWWFRFTMWMTPMFLMPAILEVSKDNTEFLAFLALIGMFMVGSAPDYEHDPFQRKVHTSGAIMCLLFSQLWVAFNCWWILIPIWLAYMVYTGISIFKQKEGVFYYKYMQTKPMFWVEICALMATYTAIAIIIKLILKA